VGTELRRGDRAVAHLQRFGGLWPLLI
jgi:hypothetical protein